MRVLLVDDDSTLRDLMRYTLEAQGYTVIEAADGLQAIEAVQKQRFDAAILDVNMPKLSGLQVLEKMREIAPSTFCIVMTAYSEVKDAVHAIKLGAYDYLEKPVDPEKVLKLFKDAQASNHLLEIAAFSAPILHYDAGRQIIGESRPIREVFDVINKLAKVDTSVLVRGESGTGKELIARAIHYNSHRRKGAFVAVNCAALPEHLIESELFGYEKGAFTGADRKKPGKFHFAEGGTLFLDEIGDINPNIQVKLLRALQEKAVVSVGGSVESKVDVRVIAATNRPLETMMGQGTFREDLFYRLNVLPIHLPPLRDRRDDIPALLSFMIKKFNEEHSRQVQCFSPEALRALINYSWPGNIRELENIVERAFILESANVISIAALPPNISGRENSSVPPTSDSPELAGEQIQSEFPLLDFPTLKEEFERDFIIKALTHYKGRINQTAEHTRMTKITLLRKLKNYGIDASSYRN
jgi:DNA-binding NtrC family response regulator